MKYVKHSRASPARTILIVDRSLEPKGSMLLFPQPRFPSSGSVHEIPNWRYLPCEDTFERAANEQDL
jgi:hypothetical protein